MTMQAQPNNATTTIPEPFQAFAERLQEAMTDALECRQNKREYGQLTMIFNCLTDGRKSVHVYGFWTHRAKALAAEWEEIRTAYLEAQAEPAQETADAQSESSGQESQEPAAESQPEAADADTKPARKYKTITYIEGQNPFRLGSKNAMVWDLLVEGGHTAEAIAEATGADLKSVNYLIWLCRRNGIEIQKSPETRTFKLLGPAPTA
jgi:hypothetical protein